MRNAGGYVLVTSPDSRRVEADTFTCIHCNRVVIVPVKASASDMGGWCALCAKPVCKNCAGKACEPFEIKLKRMEDRSRFARQFQEVTK